MTSLLLDGCSRRTVASAPALHDGFEHGRPQQHDGARFLAAWERRDTEHIMGCWADDGVYHAIPRRPIVGRAAFREFVTRFEQVPGGLLEIHHQVASDDIVMNERTDRITFRGRQIVVPICAVFEIRDGRIAAWREYFDPALFASP